MRTRRAIVRDGLTVNMIDGLTVDPAALAYCPRQWLNEIGYVDIDQVRESPLRLMT